MKNSKELHEEFVKLGRERYRLMNRLLLILPGIYESGIWEKYAADIYKYAGRFGGISKSAVDKRLGLEKHLEGKPQLREAIEKVGINKVALVATLATSQNEAIFADKALNMSKSALVALSKELRGKGSGADEVGADEVGADEVGADEVGAEGMVAQISPCRAKPQIITIELDEEMTFLFLKLKNKFKKLNNREMMRRILEEADERANKVSFARKVESVKPGVIIDDGVDLVTGEVVISDGIGDSITGDEIIRNASLRESVLSRPEPRTIKAKRRKQTLGNGRCTYPGCNKPAENIHHPQRYGKTKNHNKLVALCKDHHEFMHNGLIENEQAESRNWTMNIHKTPDAVDQLYRKCRQESLL